MLRFDNIRTLIDEAATADFVTAVIEIEPGTWELQCEEADIVTVFEHDAQSLTLRSAIEAHNTDRIEFLRAMLQCSGRNHSEDGVRAVRLAIHERDDGDPLAVREVSVSGLNAVALTDELRIFLEQVKAATRSLQHPDMDASA